MYETPAQLLATFRAEMHDKVAPYFWSNDELLAYMTQAEQLIAQRTMCLQDMSSAATCYDVAADEPDVVLHPSIYRIRGAWWVENGYQHKLDIDSVDSMVAEGFHLYTQKGRPAVMMTGAVTNGVRLYPIPHLDGQIRLSVFRVPLKPLTQDGKFEIPFQYRPALLDWMKHRALLKNDADTFSRQSASECERAFEAHMAEYTTAESMKRGGPQNGTVSYGGL